MKKRAALYIRVSTKEQNEKPQLESLQQYCKQRGWDVVGTFVDKDHGDNKDREHYQALIDFALKGKTDIVMVWKFDRFARSTSELINRLEDFKERNIDFMSYTENIDTTTAMGKVFFTIIAALAELELNNIRERIKAGMDHAKKHGTKSGRPIGRATLQYDQMKETLILYHEGELYPKQIQKKTGISKSSYYKLINGYESMKEGMSAEAAKKKHRLGKKMTARIEAIIKSEQRSGK
jgi:DNA invertase Pin-like site-specific DNA recombinase